MRRSLAVAVLVLCSTAVSFGQQQPSVEQLESRLPAATGADRGHLLTELTGLLNNDNPRKAITYGEEAVAFYTKYPNPAQEAHALALLAWAHMILSEYPTAIATAERGLKIATDNGDQRGEAENLNSLGVIAQRRGEFVDAIDRFTNALAIYRKVGKPSDIANELNNLGFVLATGLADYDRALAYQLEGLKIRESLGNQSDLALSLNNIGIIYDRTGNSDKALEYFQQALELRRNSGAKNRIAATLSNISDVYRERGEYPQALDAQRQVLALRREVGDTGGEAIALRSLGEIYADMPDVAQARRNLDEALRIAERTGDKGTLGRTLLVLSKVSRAQGKGAEAVAYAKRGLAIANETSARDLRRRAFEELSSAEEQAGDYAAALRAYKGFKEENDRVFDQEKARRLESLERRYQTEKHEKEIIELKQGEADRAIELVRQRGQLNMIAGGAVLTGLVGFGLYRRRVESARISEQLSVTDTLTGLKNRRYILQTIGGETAAVHRRLRGAAPDSRPDDADLIFLMVDVDKFKHVNDELGHKAGDAILTQVADLINESCRASDVVARWGGDEFLVVSRFTDRHRGSALAERIRAAVAQHTFDVGDGRTRRCECSVGVAAYPFSLEHADALSWEQVVAVADQALYQAKRAGANGWVSVTASAAATRAQLAHPEESLARWIADGIVTVETSG